MSPADVQHCARVRAIDQWRDRQLDGLCARSGEDHALTLVHCAEAGDAERCGEPGSGMPVRLGDVYGREYDRPAPMVIDRSAQVVRIYRDALARDESERATFVSQSCSGDETLQREVESLLR